MLITDEGHLWHTFSECLLAIYLLLDQPMHVKVTHPDIPDPKEETVVTYFTKDRTQVWRTRLCLSHDPDKFRHIKYIINDNDEPVIAIYP